MGSQNAAPAAFTTQPGGPHSAPNPIIGFMPMLFILAIFYFLLIRPQQKAAKELKAQVDALKNGDRVLTSGGILGTVVAVKGDVLVVRISEDVKVDVVRSAISRVITDGTAAGEKKL